MRFSRPETSSRPSKSSKPYNAEIKLHCQSLSRKNRLQLQHVCQQLPRKICLSTIPIVTISNSKADVLKMMDFQKHDNAQDNYRLLMQPGCACGAKSATQRSLGDSSKAVAYCASYQVLDLFTK